MFTGIILAIGKISAIQAKGGDYRFRIETGKLAIETADLGDSIAVNGVCLTAVELGVNYFCADVSNETMSRTTFKSIEIGHAVNLELALTPTTRLGGHIVSGHVDGIGVVISRKADGRSFCYRFKVPDNLSRYIAEKGSICVNGVSLTVNQVEGSCFSINLVPHTLQETTLGELDSGSEVNLEVDLLARYMERLMQRNTAAYLSDAVTTELLQKTGFIK